MNGAFLTNMVSMLPTIASIELFSFVLHPKHVYSADNHCSKNTHAFTLVTVQLSRAAITSDHHLNARTGVWFLHLMCAHNEIVPV